MTNTKKWFCSLLMTATITSVSTAFAGEGAATNEKNQPPVAKRLLKETKIHGDTLQDEYFWMREKSNPEVAAYLEAENTYTDALMASTKPLQEKLYQELLGHVKETDTSAPYKQGDYFYYSRTEQGKQYPIYCRKHLKLDAPEEIILDQNELAKGEKFMNLGGFAVSDDAHYLAYSTDNTGFRQYTLHVKDLRTGKLFPEAIPKTNSVAWANDNKTIFYVVEDSAKRPYRLYRHELGTDPAKDTLVYEEADESFDVDVYKSRSKQFIFMDLSSHTTSEVRYLPADKPAGERKTLAAPVHAQD